MSATNVPILCMYNVFLISVCSDAGYILLHTEMCIELKSFISDKAACNWHIKVCNICINEQIHTYAHVVIAIVFVYHLFM